MKGVTYITDRHNKKKAVVIELKVIGEHQQELEDLLDSIIVESRKDEESIPFEKVVKSLKAKGKL